jgi:hypothetical protein
LSIDFFLGKFGSVQLINNEMKSFQLKTESGGINGVHQQCLVYYYYMGNGNENIITVRKVETSGETETIDSVTSSPFNGWIQRKIPFNVEAPGYKVRLFFKIYIVVADLLVFQIYFDIQKTSGISTPHIGFDEISIGKGKCSMYIDITKKTDALQS